MIIFSLEGVYLMDELLNYLLNPSTLPVYILEFILSWIPFLVMFLDVQLPNGIWDDEVSEADASVDSSFEMSCHAAAIMCIPHDCFLWPPTLCLNIKVAQDLFLFSFCLLAVDFSSKNIHGDMLWGSLHEICRQEHTKVLTYFCPFWPESAGPFSRSMHQITNMFVVSIIPDSKNHGIVDPCCNFSTLRDRSEMTPTATLNTTEMYQKCIPLKEHCMPWMRQILMLILCTSIIKGPYQQSFGDLEISPIVRCQISHKLTWA